MVTGFHWGATRFRTTIPRKGEGFLWQKVSGYSFVFMSRNSRNKVDFDQDLDGRKIFVKYLSSCEAAFGRWSERGVLKRELETGPESIQ